MYGCPPPNLVNLGPQTAENCWWVFAPPKIIALGNTASLTAYNRQQANVGTCYVVAWAYSLEQQNAGLATWLTLGFAMHLVFRRLLSEVTERTWTDLGHEFTYDCYLKNLVWTPRAFTPTGWRGGGKIAFLDRLWIIFWPNISLQRSMIWTMKKKFQSTGTSLHSSQIW